MGDIVISIVNYLTIDILMSVIVVVVLLFAMHIRHIFRQFCLYHSLVYFKHFSNEIKHSKNYLKTLVQAGLINLN